MGQKKRSQVLMEQRGKRKKARDRLVKKGENLADFYYGKYYIKIK